jgi:ketosteroid isomerase-like protein
MANVDPNRLLIMSFNVRYVSGEVSASRFLSAVVIMAALALLPVGLSAEHASAQSTGGGGPPARQVVGSDSAAVADVVERYHRALRSGDSASALALLATDAVILESGGVETREEYRSHHLPADIAFARAIESVRSPVRVVVRGDVAWATSTSTTQGEFRGRAVNSVGAELMVLTRTAEGWKISAVHWSSRNRRP